MIMNKVFVVDDDVVLRSKLLSFADNTNQHLCPAPTSAAPATNAMSDVIHSGTQVEIKPPETCSWPTALQVCVFYLTF